MPQIACGRTRTLTDICKPFFDKFWRCYGSNFSQANQSDMQLVNRQRLKCFSVGNCATQIQSLQSQRFESDLSFRMNSIDIVIQVLRAVKKGRKRTFYM